MASYRKYTRTLTFENAWQIAPAGLSFTAVMTAASEFANPPNSPGVMLVGESVLMDPTYDHSGLPAGNFSVQPPLPAGLALDAQTGRISGTLIMETPRRTYTVTLANPSGKTDFALSLEVLTHMLHPCVCGCVCLCLCPCLCLCLWI